MRTFLRTSAVALLLSLGLGNISLAGEPTLEIKVQSVNQLLANAEYIGGLFDQEEAAKQFKGFIEQYGKPENGAEGFYGLDISKPAGLYAFVEEDIQESRIMLLVPVTDKEAVLKAMKELGKLDPKVEEGGYYSVEVPNFPVPVYFRFSDGYLHATLQSRANIMPKMLLKPAQFFSVKQTSIASMVLRLDEVPVDVRETMFGQFEFGYTDSMSQKYEADSLEAKVVGFLNSQLLSGLKQVLMEGKNLEATFNIKPSADQLSLDVTFDATPESELQKTILSWQNRSSVAGRLSVPENPLLLEQGNFAFSKESKKECSNLVDQVIEKVLADEEDGGKRVVAQLALDSLKPTLKSGVLDFGVVGYQEGAGLNGVLVLKVAKGSEIAKTVQTFSAFVEKKDAEFKFKIEEINGITIHKVTIKEPKFAAATHTKSVWLGTSDDLLLVSIEETGDAIRKAAKGDVASAPIAKSVLSVARLMSSGPGIDPEGEFKRARLATYGETGAQGEDTVAFSAHGGEKLTLNLTLKGKLLRFFYEVEQQKKN